MATASTKYVIALMACFAGLSLALPAAARDDTCPWGGDSSQAMRCFDCMKRVWTGQRWKLVNTCRHRTFNGYDYSR